MGFLAAIPAAFVTVGAGAAAAGSAASYAAAASIVAATVATATTAAAVGYSAVQQSKMSAYQAKVAGLNQMIAEQNRISSLEEGTVAGSSAKGATGRRVGGALAAQGANGVDVGFGTTKEYRTALQNEGDLDAMTINYNSQKRALGFATQATGYAAQGSAAAAAGSNALAAGTLGVGASFIGGASSILGKTSAYATQGITF